MHRSTVTEPTHGGNLGTQDVSFSGVSGFIFWLLIASFLFILVAFSTMGWQIRESSVGGRSVSVGLWKTCYCDGRFSSYYTDQAWFRAVQAFLTLGLICMIVGVALTIVYMFVRRVSKSLVLISFTIVIFLASLFLLIGVTVFGCMTSETQYGGGGQSYSFVMACISLILTLAVGGLSVLQMRITRLI